MSVPHQFFFPSLYLLEHILPDHVISQPLNQASQGAGGWTDLPDQNFTAHKPTFPVLGNKHVGSELRMQPPQVRCIYYLPALVHKATRTVPGVART